MKPTGYDTVLMMTQLTVVLLLFCKNSIEDIFDYFLQWWLGLMGHRSLMGMVHPSYPAWLWACMLCKIILQNELLVKLYSLYEVSCLIFADLKTWFESCLQSVVISRSIFKRFARSLYCCFYSITFDLGDNTLSRI